MIDITDYDRVSSFCDLVANQLFPQMRRELEEGIEPSDIYQNIVDRLKEKGEVPKDGVMYGGYVACLAIAYKLFAEERARRLAV